MLMESIDYTTWIPDGTLLFYKKDNKEYSGIVKDNRFYPPRQGMNDGYIHNICIQTDNGYDSIYLQILDGDFIKMEKTNPIILNPLVDLILTF